MYSRNILRENAEKYTVLAEAHMSILTQLLIKYNHIIYPI